MIILGDIEMQAVLVCILVCIITTIYWFWWYRRSSKIKNAAISKQEDNENGCNDPNCIRCHSSSQQHIETFKANVTTLRRLVKLEPALFDGMRDEIWSTIDDMLAEHSKVDTSCAPSVTPDTSIDTTSTTTQLSSLLSPQQGQNPTVFFLPGLEATPFHHHGHFLNTTEENGDESLVFEECVCIKLWKRHTAIPSTPVGKKKFPLPIPTTGDIQVLIENYQIIRQELLDYLSSDGSEESFTPFDSKVYTNANGTTKTSNDVEWSSIYLYHQGIRQSDICNKHFPQTSQILEMNCPHRLAGRCGLGSVYFSKLKRNTKVKEHCGPSNVRWRCHLPLVVPKGSNSQLRVGLAGVNEECVGWKEGVPILFDDSFVHSAVHQVVEEDDNTDENTYSNGDNDTFDGARIVLIIDFWHPALSEMDRNALGVLYPPGS